MGPPAVSLQRPTFTLGLVSFLSQSPFQVFCQVLSFGKRAIFHVRFCFHRRALISVFIFLMDVRRLKGSCEDTAAPSQTLERQVAQAGGKPKKECSLDQSQGLRTRNCNGKTSSGFHGNPVARVGPNGCPLGENHKLMGLGDGRL